MVLPSIVLQILPSHLPSVLFRMFSPRLGIFLPAFFCKMISFRVISYKKWQSITIFGSSVCLKNAFRIGNADPALGILWRLSEKN